MTCFSKNKQVVRQFYFSKIFLTFFLCAVWYIVPYIFTDCHANNTTVFLGSRWRSSYILILCFITFNWVSFHLCNVVQLSVGSKNCIYLFLIFLELSRFLNYLKDWEMDCLLKLDWHVMMFSAHQLKLFNYYLNSKVAVFVSELCKKKKRFWQLNAWIALPSLNVFVRSTWFL